MHLLQVFTDEPQKVPGMSKKDAETKWMGKAEEAIQAAKGLNDPQAKEQMLAIAKAYMQLAKYARQAELRKSQLN